MSATVGYAVGDGPTILKAVGPNRVPVFGQDLGDRSDGEGAVVSLSAGATDPDGDGLTFGAVGLPVGLGIDSLTGVVTGTVSFGAAGVYPVVVTVTDDGVPNLSATDTFVWTVTDTNRVPVFGQDLGDRSDGEGAVVSLWAGATDPDGDGLTFGAVGLPVGLGIDSLTGVVTGTVSFGAAGVYPVVVTVTDDGVPNLSATDAFVDGHGYESCSGVWSGSWGSV